MGSVAVRLDRPPHYARLISWGRGAGSWWAPVAFTQRVLTDGGAQGEISVAAWVPGSSVQQQPNAGTAAVARIDLPDDQRGWPAPRGWPGWYVGPWVGGDLVLPPGQSADNRPEWERRRERGERHERKRRR